MGMVRLCLIPVPSAKDVTRTSLTMTEGEGLNGSEILSMVWTVRRDKMSLLCSFY